MAASQNLPFLLDRQTAVRCWNSQLPPRHHKVIGCWIGSPTSITAGLNQQERHWADWVKKFIWIVFPPYEVLTSTAAEYLVSMKTCFSRLDYPWDLLRRLIESRGSSANKDAITEAHTQSQRPLEVKRSARSSIASGRISIHLRGQSSRGAIQSVCFEWLI